MVIYAILAKSTRRVKLGRTVGSAQRRLKLLQNMSGDDLELIAWADRPKEDETRLHIFFREHRLYGEWFSPKVLDVLEQALATATFDTFIAGLPSYSPKGQRQQIAPCQTAGAYWRHRKRGETCELCVTWFGAVRPSTAYDDCGTTRAYIRHRRNGEPPCVPCQASRPQRSQRAHGTQAAYLRHIRAGNPPCDVCQALHPKKVTPQCGTHKGYRRHVRTGTTPCQACKGATALFMKQYRLARRLQSLI